MDRAEIERNAVLQRMLSDSVADPQQVLAFLEQEVGTMTVAELREDLRDYLDSQRRRPIREPSMDFITIRAAAQWAASDPVWPEGNVIDFHALRIAQISAHHFFDLPKAEAVGYFMLLFKSDPKELFESIKIAYTTALLAETGV